MSWLEDIISSKHEDGLYDAYRQLYVLKNSLFSVNTIDQAEDLVDSHEVHTYLYRVKFVIIPVKINNKWKYFQNIVEAQHWISNDVISERTEYFAGMRLFESMEDLVFKRLKEGFTVKKWKLIF